MIGGQGQGSRGSGSDEEAHRPTDESEVLHGINSGGISGPY
ncbi:hypothetical protein [Priestia megaterium]|nr:hypothetical protein [Priestia megaterium]